MPEQIPFPPPIVIKGRNYYQRGRVRAWLATIAGGAPPAPQPDDEGLMTTRQVRELCGGVSDMWVWRRRTEGTAPPPGAA
jgi:hypothetical protein